MLAYVLSFTHNTGNDSDIIKDVKIRKEIVSTVLQFLFPTPSSDLDTKCTLVTFSSKATAVSRSQSMLTNPKCMIVADPKFQLDNFFIAPPL